MSRAKYTKRADGRLVTTRTDPRTGKRIYFYGQTAREIELKILKYTTASEKGRPFAVVAEEWWKDMEDSVTAYTRKTYISPYQRAIDAFGDKPIRTITSQQIRNYLKTMVRDGYATKTIKNYFMVLRQIFDHGVMCDSFDLDFNPCMRVALPEGKASTRRQAATPADEAKIKNHPREWLLPYLLIYTGLRRGEALALQWRDVDFDEMVIHVTKSTDYAQNSLHPQIKRPKSAAGIRDVPILNPLAAVLIELRNEPESYLFSDDGGESPLSEGRFQERWKQYSEKVGISATPHQLRHSYATMLNEQGVDLKTAQNWLGHSTAAMTQDIYTHVRNNKLRQDAAMLNNKLKIAK